MSPLTPWVPLYDVLRVYAPELVDPATGTITGSPEEVAVWQSAVDQATWMMWALSAGRVHPAECWTEDYSLTNNCEVNLLQSPVGVILKTEIVNYCEPTPPEPIDFCQPYPNVVSFCCSGHHGNGRGVPGCGGCHTTVVRIDYQTESTLPPGTEARVAWFADQLVKAATGDKACQLPERITSISRQGVSWTMVDPMDFLDKKLTGIGRLDSWLSTTRLVYPSSTLIDPLKSDRRASWRNDCDGAPFNPPEFGDANPDVESFGDEFAQSGFGAPTGEPFDVSSDWPKPVQNPVSVP